MQSYFWMVLLFVSTDATKQCKLDSSNKIVTFSSLLEFQANRYSFDPDHPSYQGNIVNFNFKSIDRLTTNAFVSFGSNNIIKISLNSKGIKVIDDGAFNGLFCLHYLELSHNNISSLTTNVFNGLDNLMLLDLSENSLRQVSNGMIFHSLHKLKILNLSKNNIVTLSDYDFYNLTSLEVLNLSFNKISIIPLNLFSSLHSLKELYLDNNNLIDIDPEKWTNLENLEVLYLAGNFLTKFDTTYNFSFVNLRTLNVSHNSLNYLNVAGLRWNLPKLKVIDIRGNDWYCSELDSIKYYLRDSKITIVGNVNCSTTKGYKRPTTTESPSSTSSSISVSTVSVPDQNAPNSKEIIVQNDKILLTSSRVLESVQKLQNILSYLCAIVIVFVLIDISVRTGLCRNLYNRIFRRYVDAANDRERLILLRSQN